MERNRLFIKFYGMKRSGNHPIINWLTAGFEKPVWFMNNITPFSDPFLTNYDARTLNNCINTLQKPREQARLESKHTLFISYEDANIDYLDIMDSIPNEEQKVGSSGGVMNILLLRDPFNMMASRLKSRDVNFRSGPKMPADKGVVEMWKAYAKEYLGITNLLDNKITINFNVWFKDKDYRKQICRKLMIKNKDDAINKVPTTGEGSSFDEMKFDGKAQEMKVLERWREYSDDDTFWALFDKEVLQLACKIFGANILPGQCKEKICH